MSDYSYETRQYCRKVLSMSVELEAFSDKTISSKGVSVLAWLKIMERSEDIQMKIKSSYHYQYSVHKLQSICRMIQAIAGKETNTILHEVRYFWSYKMMDVKL